MTLHCDTCGKETPSTIGGECADCFYGCTEEEVIAPVKELYARLEKNLEKGRGTRLTAIEAEEVISALGRKYENLFN